MSTKITRKVQTEKGLIDVTMSKTEWDRYDAHQRLIQRSIVKTRIPKALDKMLAKYQQVDSYFDKNDIYFTLPSEFNEDVADHIRLMIGRNLNRLLRLRAWTQNMDFDTDMIPGFKESLESTLFAEEKIPEKETDENE